MGEIWRVAGGFAVPLGCCWQFAANRLRAFGVFIQGFRDFLAGLSAFLCSGRFAGSLLWEVTWGYNYHNSHFSNYTGAIIPLVTVTKVTKPFVIDKRYCLRLAIAKSNNNGNVNLSRLVLTKCKGNVKQVLHG